MVDVVHECDTMHLLWAVVNILNMLHNEDIFYMFLQLIVLLKIIKDIILNNDFE